MINETNTPLGPNRVEEDQTSIAQGRGNELYPTEGNDGKEVTPTNPAAPSTEGNEAREMPTIKDKLVGPMPPLIEDLLSGTKTNVQYDALLLSILTVVSSAMPKVCGTYGGHIVYPNLFLLVTAMAGTGKGDLSYAIELINPISEHFERVFEEEMEQYKAKLREARDGYQKGGNRALEPEKPMLHLHVVPANCSQAAFNSALESNNGEGIIVETEADTLTNALRSSGGPYSDVFRKAFHHEPISFYRKTFSHPIIIKEPKLSILLSATPGQIPHLIPTAENGLFSRFIYYKMDGSMLYWSNVFGAGTKMLENFQYRSIELYTLYLRLQELASVTVSLSDSQIARFNVFFDQSQKDYSSRFDGAFVPSVRRMGLSTFRIMMILTVLRNKDHLIQDDFGVDNAAQLSCSDDDFENALKIAEVLLEHSAAVYLTLAQSTFEINPIDNPFGLYRKLYDTLPSSFRTSDAIKTGEGFQISRASTERNLKFWVQTSHLTRVGQGKYQKTNN